MKQIIAVYKRELRLYFRSPVAYAIAFALMLFFGLLFSNSLNSANGQGPADGVNFIPNLLTFLLFLVGPLLTMRLLAEETREGTLELLLTAPVSDNAIVIGKFLSAWFYYSVLLGLTLTYQFVLLRISTPDIAHTLCAYIGIWLYGGATLAVGLMFSALTENQIVAAFLAMATLLFLWLGDLAGQIVANLDLAGIIRQLTLTGHFSTSFAVGLVRAEDVAYYAGIMVITLFIAIRVVESHRWR